MREQPLRPALKTIPLHPGTYFRRSPAKSFELTDLQGHRDSRTNIKSFSEACGVHRVGICEERCKVYSTLVGKARASSGPLRRNLKSYGAAARMGGPLGPSSDDYQVVSMLQRFERPRCRDLAGGLDLILPRRTVGTLLGRLCSHFDAPALQASAPSRSCRGFGFDPPHGGLLEPCPGDYRVISALHSVKRRRRHKVSPCYSPPKPLGASEDDDPVFSTLLCVTRRCCHDLEEGLDISPPYQRSSGPSAHDHQLVSTLQRVKCWCRRNIAPRYLQDHSDALHWTMESLRRCKTLSLGVVAIIQWPYFVAIEALTIVQFFKRTSQEIKALGPLDCARNQSFRGNTTTNSLPFVPVRIVSISS
ncbi:hypothetical protein B0H17DRAFT_1127662 [Mycena rosella]|uniref:Uncharacterized protein n=1 Tax=Mycena rosella TaxID=1033263 RepID=A0AAD7GQ80_MYCRO|nr:hypothetical protein B0H17DRAFT_1127662 [Mycena rosella]